MALGRDPGQAKLLAFTADAIRGRVAHAEFLAVTEREPAPATSTQSSPPAAAANIPVQVSIAPNGVASQLKGYEQLSAEQKAAWTDWLARFTTSMAFPPGGLHPGSA